MQTPTISEAPEEAESRIRRRSAGVIVSRGIGAQRKFLILRAWRHWDFPKGAVELGETELQAAIRETEEETALNNLVFSWGDECCRTAVYSRDKIASYFIAESPLGIDAEITRNPVSGIYEHDELRWVPWEDLPQFLPPRLRDVMRWAAQRLDLPVLHFEEPPGSHSTRTRHSHVRAISLPESATPSSHVISAPAAAKAADAQQQSPAAERPELHAHRFPEFEDARGSERSHANRGPGQTRGAIARDADGRPERKERRDQFGRIVSRPRKNG